VSFTPSPPGPFGSAATRPARLDPARAPAGGLVEVCQDDDAAHNPERQEIGALRAAADLRLCAGARNR